MVVVLAACSTTLRDDVPMPTSTPFDECPSDRAIYLASYRRGYDAMLTGRNCRICSRGPVSVSIMGWDAGQSDAYLLWAERFDAAIAAGDRASLITLISGLEGDPGERADAILSNDDWR